jgi:hypothetical protein
MCLKKKEENHRYILFSVSYRLGSVRRYTLEKIKKSEEVSSKIYTQVADDAATSRQRRTYINVEAE